jgi:FkbM family methyltransferase
MYHSQYGQDKFFDEKVFKKMTDGIFLELGADDGENGSNTIFFEQERDWTGLCIEPRLSSYKELIKNRHCITANVAISNKKSDQVDFLEVQGGMGQLSGLVDTFDPRHLARVKKETAENNTDIKVIQVPSITLNELLKKNNMNHIDYLSLDTEGGELEILQSIDYNRFSILCMSVENKYEDPAIYRFLKSKGYRLLTRFKIDDLFVLRGSQFDIYHEPWKHVLIRLHDRWYRKFKGIIKKLIGYKKD